MLAGCDYLENVKGLGIKKVLSHFKNDGGMKTVDVLLGRFLSESETKEYIKNVEKTCLCFTNQLVFNSSAKRESDRLVPCNPQLEFAANLKLGNLEDFTGKAFKFVDSYSKGEREFKNSLEIRAVEAVDFKQLIRFYSYIPRTDIGFVSNMTARTVTMSNFSEMGDVVDRSDNEEFYEKLKKSREEVRQRSRDRAESRQSVATNRSVYSFSTAVTKKKILKTGGNDKRMPFKRKTARKSP